MSNRIRIQRNGHILTILIPVRKNFRAIIWVLSAAVPWVIILWVLVRRSQLNHTISWAPEAYLLAIILWFGVGIAGYTFLSWMFFGRERIVITPDQVLIEKPLVFYNRRNYYSIEEIQNLRAGKEIYKAREKGIWVDRERTIIQFDYPGKQVVFGRGISAEEAETIILAMAEQNLIPVKAFAPAHLL
jgi:hypothetical protein